MDKLEFSESSPHLLHDCFRGTPRIHSSFVHGSGGIHRIVPSSGLSFAQKASHTLARSAKTFEIKLKNATAATQEYPMAEKYVR